MSGKLRSTPVDSTWRRLSMGTWSAPNDPTVYGTMTVDVTNALEFIEQVRKKTGVKVTITHLVGKGAALAIADQPEVNGIISWGRLLKRETVDIFFQVATEGGRDLSGAKLDGVDGMSVTEVARALSGEASKIRGGADPHYERPRRLFKTIPVPILGALMRVTTSLIHDLQVRIPGLGMERDPFGSAMVTNVGGFGLETGFAPLVPMTRVPIIVLVGVVRKMPAVVDDEVEVRPMLTLCATFDHRMLDGFQAGNMAARMRGYLEDPWSAEEEFESLRPKG